MPLFFVRDDITRMETDAVVLPANPLLEPGPGTSKAIYVAAGQEKLEGELRLSYPDGCEVGKAVITHGYDLPAKWVIHAVCPQWLGGDQGEREFLMSVYRESLKLARDNKCSSISFPLLSAGSYRFPRFDAIRIGVDTILDFLMEYEMDVYMVFFGKDAWQDGCRLFGNVESRITEEDILLSLITPMKPRSLQGKFDKDDWYDQRQAFQAVLDAPEPTEELSKIMEKERETFHDMLFRLISEKGMTEPQVYKGAHLTRQHFGKIKQNAEYRPKKKAILALAVAMHLTTSVTEELLAKAGHVLSDCEDFDLVMKYCFDRRIYDFKTIDRFLEHFGLYDDRFLQKKRNSKEKTE